MTSSFGAGANDIWVLKLDADGNVGTPSSPIPGTWQKTYGGSYNEDAHSVRETSDGGYILGALTGTYGAYDIWVLKLNSDGSIAWQKTYDGGQSDTAHFIQETSDGGYIVAGNTNSFGAGDLDIWVLKLYPDDQPNPGDRGVIEWQKTYGGVRRN